MVLLCESKVGPFYEHFILYEYSSSSDKLLLEFLTEYTNKNAEIWLDFKGTKILKIHSLDSYDRTL